MIEPQPRSDPISNADLVGLGLRLALLVAVVVSLVVPPLRRRRVRAAPIRVAHAKRNRPRDIFLRERPLLMLLIWGGIPFAAAFLLLSVLPH